MVLIENYYGYNQYLWSFIILVASLFLSTLFHFSLRRYLFKFFVKPKNDISVSSVNKALRPVFWLMVSVGLYISLKSLPAVLYYNEFIDAFFFLVAVFLVSSFISLTLKIFINSWLRVRKRFERTPAVLYKIVSVTVYLIASLIVLAYFGVEITPLVATLGLGGLAVGLALQQTLSDFFAGLHIISDRFINVGDHIELEGGIAGYVEDIGWRSTIVRTLPNNIVIIPNAKLAESIITNHYMPDREMAVLVECGVDYTSDLNRVEEVTVDVAKKIQKTVPGAVKDFEPFIRFHTFADSNINFTVILRAEMFVDKYLITNEFIKALKERYDKENIVISWPIRRIYREK